MKKIKIMAVLFCLLACASQVSAQLIIRNNGHAEVGHDPFDPLPANLNPDYYNQLDTVTVLKLFGSRGESAAGAHMSFGDNLTWNLYNVTVGELGYVDSDCLWLQGKHGTYLTAGYGASDTIMYYDYRRSSAVQFNKDVQTSGLFVQSDERFKENVEPIEDVLGSLKGLEAVSYNLKNDCAQTREAVASLPAVTDKDIQDKAFFEQYYSENEKGSERYGFLAQNVKEVFPDLVHTDNSGYMYVDYIGLIPILVQSINELSAKLEEVTGEKQEVPAVMMQTQQQAGIDENSAMYAAKLYQNAPNPWSSETVIRYSLPQSVVSADIFIYDMQGTQLKRIPAQGRGENQVILTAHDLKAGMYIYALVADGALIDSKQMILTK